MLGAMLRPTSGSVVDGIDLATAPERELPTLRSRHLGFVFQDFNVLSALSAWENVELACNLGGTTGSKARDRAAHLRCTPAGTHRSEEHTSELQSLMRISYAVFCLKKKTTHTQLF